MQKHLMKATILSVLFLLPACAQDGKPSTWGPKHWDTGVRPPEKLNNDESYFYQKDDEHCTPELKKVGGC